MQSLNWFLLVDFFLYVKEFEFYKFSLYFFVESPPLSMFDTQKQKTEIDDPLFLFYYSVEHIINRLYAKFELISIGGFLFVSERV